LVEKEVNVGMGGKRVSREGNNCIMEKNALSVNVFTGGSAKKTPGREGRAKGQNVNPRSVERNFAASLPRLTHVS
jgi:hypothetical protein